MHFTTRLVAVVLGFASSAFAVPQPSGITASPNQVAAQAAARTLTINIHNAAKIPVSLSYIAQPGPGFINPTVPAALAPSATTQILAPTGWDGTIFVGGSLNPNNSLIEANLKAGTPNIDVSYVQGFSVPIVCGCGAGSLVTGCNKPLFKLNKCPDERPGPVCVNPQYNVDDGPATPFFAPCQGAAYTYPLDGGADATCGNHLTLNCCIGPACNPSVKQSP